MGCLIHCAKLSVIENGPFTSTIIEGPEYETTFALGSNLGVDDLKAIAYMNLLCDKLGLDTISTGGVLAFATECYERKVITKENTDGLELKWGDYNTFIELIKMVAERRGIGDVLAEGTKKASEIIGRGSEKYAMHVKGLELPAYDPRGSTGFALAYATSERGACHLRAWTLDEELAGEVDRLGYEGKAALVIAKQNNKTVVDSLGICWQMGFLPVFSQLLSAATGFEVRIVNSNVYPWVLEDLAIKVDGKFIKVGERIWNLIRVFNVREGFKREDDTLPLRFFEDPLPSGPLKGRKLDKERFNKMLSDYYAIRGWDENGVPTYEKLAELGLDDLIKDLKFDDC
jgi:aldehyde:ferredoxin oxidoreductase